MKVLYIDTTSTDLVVALIEEETICDFSTRNCGHQHSETLCLKVEEAISACSIAMQNLDAYACAVGPGSFTGIRIGISTIKGYNLAIPKPLIAVNCLDAISLSKKCGAKYSAVIDAGNGFYFADIKSKMPCLIDYDDVRAKNAGWANGGADCLDGVAEIIRESFAKRNFCDELEPLYIRKSQAEITKKIELN